MAHLTKKREMNQILRSIASYCLFLLMIYTMVSGRTNYSAFHLQDHMSKTFIKFGHRELDFSKKVRTSNHFWHWVHTVILQEVRAQRWYNNDPPYGLRGFLDDRYNRIMGYSILRQVRSDPRKCRVAKEMNKMFTCSGKRGQDNEETRCFCDGWHRIWHNCSYPEFCFTTRSNSSSVTGKLGHYSGNGYIIHLNGSQKEDMEKLKNMQRMRWIDKHTRAVMLEFSIYNTNVNLFLYCRIMAEFKEGGGITPSWRFDPMQLTTPEDLIWGNVVIVCELLFIIATVLFTLMELWKIKKLKMKYFAGYWNLAEVCILMSSYATVGVHVFRGQATQNALKLFRESRGTAYVVLDSALWLDNCYLYLLSSIIFFSTLKLIKLLQFNKKFDLLALTIRGCWDELFVFFITMGIVFFAFCCIFYYIFLTKLPEFSYMTSTAETTLLMMLGKFDYKAMYVANPLSPLLFFIFSITNSVILINVMLTIIIGAFKKVKADIQQKGNKYELVNYVLERVRRVFTQETIPDTSVNPEFDDDDTRNSGDPNYNTDQLPDKVSQMMAYINILYFDGKLDMNDRATVKETMRRNLAIPTVHHGSFPASTTSKQIISSD